MQAAKIDEIAWIVEDVGEAVVRIERFRASLAIGEDDRVRNIVVIDETHRGSGLYRPLGGSEGEIVDGDRRLRRLGGAPGKEGESGRDRDKLYRTADHGDLPSTGQRGIGDGQR